MKKWVWHSTDDSIKTGKISILAIIETLVVVTIYISLAFYFNHQWWLFISVLAAPMILLRSPQSEKLGVKWLKNYWRSKTNRTLGSSSFIQLTIFIAVITILSILISSFLTSLLEIQGLEWQIVIGFLILITILSACIFTLNLSSKIFGKNFINPLVSLFGCIIGLLMGVIVGMIIAFIIPFIFSCVIAILGFNADGILNVDVIASIIGFISIYICVVLGIGIGTSTIHIWLYSLFIRICATLRYPIYGLANLPKNWKELLWVIDFTHLPELLPSASKIEPLFAVKNLIFAKNSTGKEYFVKIVIGLFWYFTALLWRWSLKATLWVWWILAFLATPTFQGLTEKNIRNEIAIRINGIEKWRFLVITIFAAWLIVGNYPEFKPWLETLDNFFGKFILKLIDFLCPPPIGLCFMALIICWFFSLIIWFKAKNFSAVNKQIIEEITIWKNLEQEDKQLFLEQGLKLERWYIYRTVSLIIVGYSFVLYFLHQLYPYFIPLWLGKWL